MNDEQRQLALNSLQSDVDSLRKFNANYERELQEIDEAIAELEAQKTPLKNQISHNNALIEALEATLVLVQNP